MENPDELFEAILLRTTVWAEMQARQVLEKGRPLNREEIKLARRIGVQYPEEVLLLAVATMPSSEEADLRQALQESAIVAPHTNGLTIGYSIFLLQDCLSDALLAHQLTHVAQCENCGSIPGFFEKYLSEVNEYGCGRAPMEVEAVAFAAREFPATAS